MTPPGDLTCAVCGGVPNGNRYGPLACLGCIVFFRRAVQKGNVLDCEKQCKRFTESGIKTSCRSCRLHDCLDAGMNPNAIQIRDKLGPREPSLNKENTIAIGVEFDCFLLLQKKQRDLHQRHYSHYDCDDGTDFVKVNNRPYHRAKVGDMGLTLKIGFRNASKWAKQFGSFLKLEEMDQKLILSEFGIAFLLIDQAHKTVCKGDTGFWLLQNDSFLHSDYFFAKLNPNGFTKQPDNVAVQEKYHNEFVLELMQKLRNPFSLLKIDNFECVMLKNILLSSPSFFGGKTMEGSQMFVSKCMSNLMDYSCVKSPENGMVRFGEIVLLMRNIRTSVKSFYNQTKRSDEFDVSKFDFSVRNSLLS